MLRGYSLALVAVAAVYLALMYAVGFLAGNGYSVDLREPVIGVPERLGLGELGASMTHVAARVWGPAYKPVPFNSSEPVRVEGYHFTIGSVDCSRVEGTEDIYMCRGTGYLLQPVGFREEFLRRGERTAYYYAGWLDVALYSIHQAYYSALLLAPIVAGLSSYAAAKLGARGSRLAALTLAALAAYAAGAAHGLNAIPDILSPYLSTPIAEVAAAGVLASLGAAGIAYQAATGWRRRSIVENTA